MVPTDYFVSAMQKHWTDTLNNHVTDNLTTVWSQMASAFNGSIIRKEQSHAQWTLVNPETGTGKSEGSYLYLGLLGRHAMRHMEHGSTVSGAIFVARTITQCEIAVEKINSHAGQEVATTKHSQNKVTLQEVQTKPILVVTHEAFVRAVEKDLNGNFIGVWQSISSWLGGPRKLTIVDESLTNVVEHHIVSGKAIHKLLGDVPIYTQNKYTGEIEVLRRIEQIIFDSRKARLEGRSVLMGWQRQGFDLPPAGLNWQGFMDELANCIRDKRLSPDIIKSKIALHRMLLRSVEGITNSWSYHASTSGDHVLTSSRFKVPADVPGPVILDATASQDVVSYLLGDEVCKTLKLPRSRNYGNVTLHVARDSECGIGKGSMNSGRTPRVRTLLKTIRKKNREGNKWLVVCHKDVEETIDKLKPTDVHLSKAHWGAIDGKNDWNDHDNVVIFGLSYRDEVWAENSMLAVNDGEIDEAAIRRAGQHTDKLMNRVLSADIIQAVNRIRCRKVIDKDGNCPSAHVWLILPSNTKGDYILQALKDEMPGISVVSWNYHLEKGEGVETDEDLPLNPDNWQDAVITHLRNADVGEYLAVTVAKRLGFDDVMAKKFRTHLKDPTTALRTRLAAMGVTLRVTGAGRGAQTLIHRPFELAQ